MSTANQTDKVEEKWEAWKTRLMEAAAHLEARSGVRVTAFRVSQSVDIDWVSRTRHRYRQYEERYTTARFWRTKTITEQDYRLGSTC
jgi:hypothetical protein